MQPPPFVILNGSEESLANASLTFVRDPSTPLRFAQDDISFSLVIPCLTRNLYKWIPAYAGMTFLFCYNHVMSKITPLEYLSQIRVELQKVKWPSHQQAVKLTLIIVFVSLVVGLYISGLDVIFTKLIQSIIS